MFSSVSIVVELLQGRSQLRRQSSVRGSATFDFGAALSLLSLGKTLMSGYCSVRK